MGLDGHDHGHGQRHEVLESIVGTHGRAQYPHYPQKTGAREATCCPKTGSAKAFRWRGVRSGSAEFLGHAWSTPLGGTHEVVGRTTHDPKIPRPSSTSQPRRTSHTHTHRGYGRYGKINGNFHFRNSMEISGNFQGPKSISVVGNIELIRYCVLVAQGYRILFDLALI